MVEYFPAPRKDRELIALCRSAVRDLALIKEQSEEVLRETRLRLRLAEKIGSPLISPL
jgi:hypothetical protein